MTCVKEKEKVTFPPSPSLPPSTAQVMATSEEELATASPSAVVDRLLVTVRREGGREGEREGGREKKITFGRKGK